MLADCCRAANEHVVLVGLLECVQLDADMPKPLLDLTLSLSIGLYQTVWACQLLDRVDGCLMHILSYAIELSMPTVQEIILLNSQRFFLRPSM